MKTRKRKTQENSVLGVKKEITGLKGYRKCTIPIVFYRYHKIDFAEGKSSGFI